MFGTEVGDAVHETFTVWKSTAVDVAVVGLVKVAALTKPLPGPLAAQKAAAVPAIAITATIAMATWTRARRLRGAPVRPVPLRRWLMRGRPPV
jgi:hypothetical protein